MDNVWFFFAGRPVYLYGVMTGLGLIFATWLAIREGKRRGIGRNRMYDYILGSATVFFLVGRIPVIWNMHGIHWLLRPWVLLTQLHTGIHIQVGTLATIAFSIWFVHHHNLILGIFLDAITSALALLQVFAALGSNLYGNPTDVPWAVSFGDLQVHPLPLYYALGYYVIFHLVWRSRKSTGFDGQLFIAYLALSAWLHWAISFVRVMNNARTMSLLYLVAGIGLLVFWGYLSANAQFLRRRRRSFLAILVEVFFFLILMVAIVIIFYSRFV